jgi:hypothetical protein
LRIWGNQFNQRSWAMTLAAVALCAAPAAAKAPYGRSCAVCHIAPPPGVDSPSAAGFTGLADPDESATGAADRGLSKVFTVQRGQSVDLKVLIDLLVIPKPVKYAVSLNGMEQRGVEQGGNLGFLASHADPAWFRQTGILQADPARPYYTNTAYFGPNYTMPVMLTFSLAVSPTADLDYYNLFFSMGVSGSGSSSRFARSEHFYLRVIPEPAAAVLLLAGGVALVGRRRRRGRPLPAG